MPSVELVKEWIEKNTVPTSYHEASLQADVRAAICKAFKVERRRDFVIIAGLVGLVPRRQKRRHFAYQYPGESHSRFVKLTK